MEKQGDEGASTVETTSSPLEAATHTVEDFRQLFQKGARFTEELLDENERLRFRVAALEAKQESAGAAVVDVVETSVAALQRRVAVLETERARLIARFHEVELANLDFKSRYAEIEEEHNNLANLYVASYQLHSTPTFHEVVRIIAEIVINLVGVERFSLQLWLPSSQALVPVFAEGVALDEVAPLVVGVGADGRALAERAVRVRAKREDPDAPRAVIPLVTGAHFVGAIVIDALLVQKDDFSRMDVELFHLLGTHAAASLLAGLSFEGGGAERTLAALDATRLRAIVEGEGARDA